MPAVQASGGWRRAGSGAVWLYAKGEFPGEPFCEMLEALISRYTG